MISDFKVLLFRSWHLLGGGRDFLSAELLAMDISHTDTPFYFLPLIALSSVALSHLMSKFDQGV